MKGIILIGITMLALGGVVTGSLLLGLSRLSDHPSAAPVVPAQDPKPPVRQVDPSSRTASAPSSPRTVVLKAADAQLHGSVLKLPFSGTKEICYWTDPKSSVQWAVQLPQAGLYRVDLWLACEGGRGGQFVLTLNDQKLTARPRNTAGPHSYTVQSLGEITVDRIRGTLTIKPDGPINGTLMNLREVRLIPK